MKKVSFWNVVWGLLFIAAAGLIILQMFGMLGELNVWALAISIIVAAGVIACAIKMAWFGMFLLLAALAYIYRVPIENMLEVGLNIWALLGIAVLLSIGFQILFGSSKKKKHKDWVNVQLNHDVKHTIEDASGEKVYFSERFTGASKYIKSDNLSFVGIENSFGGMEVYFENAVLSPEGAVVEIENKYGGLELYIPGGWNIVNNVSNFGGGTHNPKASWTESAPTLTLQGTNKFGGIDIKLV